MLEIITKHTSNFTVTKEKQIDNGIQPKTESLLKKLLTNQFLSIWAVYRSV